MEPQQLLVSLPRKKILCEIHFIENISIETLDHITEDLYELAHSLDESQVKCVVHYIANSTHILYELDYATYDVIKAIAPQNVVCIVEGIKSIN
jgi:hypothetical protein